MYFVIRLKNFVENIYYNIHSSPIYAIHIDIMWLVSIAYFHSNCEHLWNDISYFQSRSNVSKKLIRTYTRDTLTSARLAKNYRSWNTNAKIGQISISAVTALQWYIHTYIILYIYYIWGMGRKCRTMNETLTTVIVPLRGNLSTWKSNKREKGTGSDQRRRVRFQFRHFRQINDSAKGVADR